MYAAVKRQGLDRASKQDIDYCTTWLRREGLAAGGETPAGRSAGDGLESAREDGTGALPRRDPRSPSLGGPEAENASRSDADDGRDEGERDVRDGATGATGIFDGRRTQGRPGHPSPGENHG